jgi:phosphoglycerate kinase
VNKLTIRDVDVSGKNVLLRCDFNVPIFGGIVTDDNRIMEALPTINYLLERGARLVICSHLGRPKGFDKEFSLQPVFEKLRSALRYNIKFAFDVVGKDAVSKHKKMTDGSALLLENLRFEAGEEENDKDFCEKLAAFGEIYVDDAFGTVHRKHASTFGVVDYGFIKTAVAGLLVEKEIMFFSVALENPNRPFVAVLGGAKVSDKIEVIDCLIKKCDTLLIGGGMAATFLRAKDISTGKSKVEENKIDLARTLLQKALLKGVNFILPVDYVSSSEFPSPIESKIDVVTHKTKDFSFDMMGLDIGENTISLFSKYIKKAGTVLWNGPMGVFENPQLSKGTFEIANAISQNHGTTIVGGGDSGAAVIEAGLKDEFTHVSTGGGASLEMLKGKDLPGISCLCDKA